MRSYANPTADTAIRSVDREIRRYEILAEKIRDGRLSPEEERRARRQFTGIFRRILLDTLREDK